MEEQVRRSDRLAAIGELAAGMAHEIRNPLASLSGSITMLREELQLEGTGRELMEIVTSEISRLDALITDFLGFASPREPLRVPDRSRRARARDGDAAAPVAPGPVAGRGRRAGRAPGRWPRSTRTWCGRSSGTSRATPSRRCPAAGLLEIVVAAADDAVTVAFADSGGGHPAGARCRRSSRRSSRPRSAARVSAWPSSSKSSRPTRARRRGERAGPRHHGAGGLSRQAARIRRGGGVSGVRRERRVGASSSSTTNRASARCSSVMLAKEGCAVSAASGRADLERLLAGEPYDLVVTDMRMPDISGLEVLEMVRERAPGARMLVMTAFPSADATIEAIQKGAVDYIIKEGDYLGRIRLFVRETLARGRDEGGGRRRHGGAGRGAHRLSHRRQPGARGDLQDHRPGRRPQEHRADHRGERHRQGAGRPRDPRAQPAPRPARWCRSTAAP